MPVVAIARPIASRGFTRITSPQGNRTRSRGNARRTSCAGRYTYQGFSSRTPAILRRGRLADDVLPLPHRQGQVEALLERAPGALSHRAPLRGRVAQPQDRVGERAPLAGADRDSG